MVKVEIVLEYPSGLTEEAIESQYRGQFGEQLADIDVQQE